MRGAGRRAGTGGGVRHPSRDMDDDSRTKRAAASGAVAANNDGGEKGTPPPTPGGQSRPPTPPTGQVDNGCKAANPPTQGGVGSAVVNPAAASSTRRAQTSRMVVTAPLGFPWTTAPLVQVEAELLREVSNVGEDRRVVCPGGDGVPQVTKKSFHELYTHAELTDEHLNAYFGLFNTRHWRHAYAVNSFVYPNLGKSDDVAQSLVQSLTRRAAGDVDLLGLHYVLVPINLNKNHWSLVVLDLHAHCVLYLDSLRDTPSAEAVSAVRRWFEEAVREHYSAEQAAALGLSAWPVLMNEGMPRQRDGYNCGVFVVGYAHSLGQGVPFCFGSGDGDILRRRIALDLLFSLGGT